MAKHGSIRKAAVAIGISHATVSRRLAAFEESLGVKLLERAAALAPEDDAIRIRLMRARREAGVGN